MTRLSQASDEDYARRINSRRKVNANLTMIAAGSGGAALALRGSKAGFGHAAKVASSEAKALKLASASKHAHKASDITGIAAGTAGSIAGINSASTQLSDIKRNKIKERKAKKLTLKDISQGQAVDINQTPLNKPMQVRKSFNSKRKQYFYGNNLEQRRSQRNKIYPGAAAAGSATAAGGIGLVALGNKRKTKITSSRNTANTAADKLKSKADGDFAARDSFRKKSAAFKTAGDKANVDFELLRANKVKDITGQNEFLKQRQANRYRATRNSNLATGADVSGTTNRIQEVASRKKAEASAKKLGKFRYRKLPSNKKAAIVLGGASAGLAGLSAVAHRNNKKVNRPRHDWWQG